MRLIAIAILIPALAASTCAGPVADPFPTDTDGDGLNDEDEVHTYMTNRLLADTEGDGLSDGDEVLVYLTNPTRSDTDADGLSDGDEVLIRLTDPLDPDTDGDGLLDGLELAPYFGSNPLDPDTDDDGFLDGEELDLALDLLRPNSVGTVTRVFCEDYILVTSAGGAGVYAVKFDGTNEFTLGFLVGDLVAFMVDKVEHAPTGAIRANLRTRETGFGNWGGELMDYGGTIIDVAPTTLFIKVQISNGWWWAIGFLGESEVQDWYLGDDVEIFQWDSSGMTFYDMLNCDACESVGILPSVAP